MSEPFRSHLNTDDLIEHFETEYEVNDVQLIGESLPMSDRQIRLYTTANESVIVHYDTPAYSEGDSIYDREEVEILGRGDYNLGLSRLMATHCTITIDPELGIQRLEE